MSNITRVGVDLAKNLIQVHAVDLAGKVLTNRDMKRETFLQWCAQLPAPLRLVGRDTITNTGINLHSLDPVQSCLRHAANLGCN